MKGSEIPDLGVGDDLQAVGVEHSGHCRVQLVQLSDRFTHSGKGGGESKKFRGEITIRYLKIAQL